jgi:hypothetical protein
VKLRAHWAGDPPKVGDYVMSTMRPKYAYLVTAVGELSGSDLELIVDRVSPFEVPDDAVVHSWKWDSRDKKVRA